MTSESEGLNRKSVNSKFGRTEASKGNKRQHWKFFLPILQHGAFGLVWFDSFYVRVSTTHCYDIAKYHQDDKALHRQQVKSLCHTCNKLPFAWTMEPSWWNKQWLLFITRLLHVETWIHPASKEFVSHLLCNRQRHWLSMLEINITKDKSLLIKEN